jgi:hypothetical protein
MTFPQAWRSIGTFTRDGKTVAALSHYQTKTPRHAAAGWASSNLWPLYVK